MTDVGTARLVEQLGSPDTNERALALAGLVRLGRAASPALRGALEDGPEHVRAQAAQALAEIADPATADELAVHTRDGNPDVRHTQHSARATVTATGWDWPALWTSLGRYDPDTEPAEREAAAAQWAAWCRANC